MHCPSCGQQQISHETKFCNRCGMPLGLVAEILANGGYLPQLAELSQQKRTLLTRRNGLGFGVVWLISLLALTAIGGGVFNNEYFGATMAILATFGAAVIFIASLIFLKPEKKLPLLDRVGMAGLSGVAPGSRASLSPGQSMGEPPINPGWRDTSDLQPTSVTDSTTRLLDKDR